MNDTDSMSNNRLQTTRGVTSAGPPIPGSSGIYYSKKEHRNADRSSDNPFTGRG